MGGNRGFKGIDKRAFQTSNAQRKDGTDNAESHVLQRKIFKDYGNSAGILSNYQLKAEDWVRCGFSASFSADSGSKMFHSPDTGFGSNWWNRSTYSKKALVIGGFKDITHIAKYSFRIGNCINGNANGSYWTINSGLMPITKNGREFTEFTYDGTIPGYPAAGNAWKAPINLSCYSADNQMTVYMRSKTQGAFTVAQGDLIECTIDAFGAVRVYQNGALFVSCQQIPTWGDWGAASHREMKPLDLTYVVMLNSYQEGAEGNFGTYDHQFSGEVIDTPRAAGFESQLHNQTLLPISASTWGSGSVQATAPYMATSATGSEVHYRGGSYTTPIWSEQYLTGSGLGGVVTFTLPSSSVGTNQIASINRHDFLGTYSHYTYVATHRTYAKTWGDTTKTAAYDAGGGWYQWNTSAGAGTQLFMNSGDTPLASGSKVAFVITGSDAAMFGGQGWNFGSNTAANSQVVAQLWKMVDTSGNPLCDYVSDDWILVNYGIYWGGAAYGRDLAKFGFNDGDAGTKNVDVRIGEQWIASGSG